MKSHEIIKMAGGNLNRRKSRTFLTLLGIIIGTISIVLMVAVGLGMRDSVNAQFDSMTSVNVIEVSKGDNVSSTTRLAEQSSDSNIEDIDLDFFASIEGVEAVSPVLTATVKMVSGKYDANINMIGLDVSLMETLGFVAYEGELPTETQQYQVFFGPDAIDSFKEIQESNQSNQGGNAFQGRAGGPGKMGGMMMGGRPPVSNDSDTDTEQQVAADYDVNIFLDRIRMTLDTSYNPTVGTSSSNASLYRTLGVGILEEGDMTRDRMAYMSLDLLKEMEEDYAAARGTTLEDGYDSAYVKVADLDDIESVQNYIEAYGYTTQTSSTFVETMQSTTETLQIALGAIGAVALLVAGIGITNTMIMAIQERRKEIGVMKVIGATIKDIKKLFLIEAAMIGLIGGLIGIGLSYIGTFFLTNVSLAGIFGNRSAMSSIDFSIPVWLIFAGLGFTTLLGIIAGYIPAVQATRASALEALRNE